MLRCPRSAWAETRGRATRPRVVGRAARAMVLPTTSSGRPTRAARVPRAPGERGVPWVDHRPTAPASRTDSRERLQPAWRARVRPDHRARHFPTAAGPGTVRTAGVVSRRAEAWERILKEERSRRADPTPVASSHGAARPGGRTSHRPVPAQAEVARTRAAAKPRAREGGMRILCPTWNRPATVRRRMARRCPAVRPAGGDQDEPDPADRDRIRPP